MMQGRESRSTTVRAFACALMAILAFAAVVPVMAPTSAFAQAAGDEYDQPNIPNGGTDTSPAAASAGSDSDDDGGGGTSILLVALAAVAAVCAGFAAWRLRGSDDDDDDHRPKPVAPPTPSTGGETQ